MMAAVSAARMGADVTIYEKNDRVGKKLLSTGNGRCNITNDGILETDEKGRLIHYYGQNRKFCEYALKEFDNNALLGFFNELGVLFRNENGKYFPYSETASTILDVLRFYCERLGIKLISSSKINEITDKKDFFVISDARYDKVIIACGGASCPHLGTDGSGYSLLEGFSHTRTELTPAITQIKTDNKYTKQLKGIKCNAEVSVFKGKKALRREYGQVLFADYGLSGPPIFQLSSCLSGNDSDMTVELDFMPEFSFSQVCDNLIRIKTNPYSDRLTAEGLLLPMLNKKVGQIIIKDCGISLSQPVSEINISQLKSIADRIKHFRLKALGTKGFANAQVTSGGIDTNEFDERTMQSKLKHGLYACGEVLDITGDCGGYNLQWAFASGYIAGRSAAYD